MRAAMPGRMPAGGSFGTSRRLTVPLALLTSGCDALDGDVEGLVGKGVKSGLSQLTGGKAANRLFRYIGINHQLVKPGDRNKPAGAEGVGKIRHSVALFRGDLQHGA